MFDSYIYAVGIALAFFLLIVFYLFYESEFKWKKISDKAIATGKCPWCGYELDRHIINTKEGPLEIHSCKACDFSTSRKVVD